MEKQIRKIRSITRIEPLKAVAAYARVSSDKESMLHSLGEQVSYYSMMIHSHPEWRYAGIYADEAITGTKADRPEFQRMLADCRAGKIHMIITKSITRFARDTVTSLQTVRELKALGIDVFFEKENIHTLGTNGEFLLTVVSALAQEESKSVSDNQKWRNRNAEKEGNVICWRFQFGYKITKGKAEIDPVEGPIAREAFERVARGDSLNSVVRWLNSNGYYGALGGKWQTPRLRNMLSNEKYKGDALLQKTYVNNHLEKKKMPNRGELPQYYATETHPALIDPETFAAVQQRLAAIAEKNAGRPPRHTNECTGRIRCPNCGRNYRRITKNGSFGWLCPTYHMEGKAVCTSKNIPEETLRTVLAEAPGLDAWQPDVFRNQVDHIIATGPNTLEVHMKDSSVQTVEWKDRSRRESWTPEMKEKARQDALRRHHG